MKAVYRLKKNYQYKYVYKHAKSVSDKEFVLLFCKSGAGASKIGFSIGKKFGKAVKRNRLRRQLKAAASLLMPNIQNGFNLIVIPRKDEPYTFLTIINSLKVLFVKAGVLA